MKSLDPLVRRQIGASLVLAGLSFVIVSAAFAGGHYFRRSSALADAQGRVDACQVNLRLTKGNVVATRRDRITVTWSGLQDAMATLSVASSAASICPGWQMSEFCMGNACKPGGTTLVLDRLSG